MAPDWEKLAEEWEGNAVGLVAEVDCTADGKPLCDANGVRGFPTLKYGDPTSLDDYQGGRSFDALSAFAKENLKPVCSPSNLDICDDDKKKQIEELMAKSDEELASAIAAEEKKLEDAEEEFKQEVEKLQKNLPVPHGTKGCKDGCCQGGRTWTHEVCQGRQGQGRQG